MGLTPLEGKVRGRMEIVEGRRGFPTVKVAGENGCEAYLHSIYDPVREASAASPGRVDAATLVFLGAGLGYHIPQALLDNPQTKRVVIVEIYPELARCAASRVENPDIALDVVCAGSTEGPPAIPAGLIASEIRIIPHTPSINANPSWYSECQAILATAGRHGKGDHLPSCGRPLNITLLYGAYYCQSECKRGLESLGHRVAIIDYRAGDNETVFLLQKAISEGRADLVFCINMRGMDRRGVMSEMLRRTGIPLAIWFVDSPEFILQGELLPPPDVARVFLWDKSYTERVRSLGYAVDYLPLAADEGAAMAASRSERFCSGVSFVGNALIGGFLSRLASRFPKTPEMLALADRAAAAVVNARGCQVEALDDILSAEECGPMGEERLFLRAYAMHSATTIYRSALLERLLPHGVTFFGDPEGWRELFGRCIDARPDVNYFSETPSVYASSEISFNATSLQMPHGVNQRIFDAPLCGGFLLTDRQGALFELFAENEVAVYDGPGDVAEKAAFYLAEPGLRGEIAAKARQRILGEHTYRVRMGQMLEKLRS